MVSALERKLWRDLVQLRGQVLTISLVVACGIASYITMRTAYDSLVHSRDKYYEQYRFADVFASLERAPRPVRARLEGIDGVSRVDTRVVERVLVPIPGSARPASGTIVGHDYRQSGSRLNDVYIKAGRDLDPTRQDEILLLDGFAAAHDLAPGDEIDAVINGTLRTLSIVGLALSPEYVMAMAPGQLSYDPALVPVIWMNESALEAAFRMEGGFNDVTMQLEPRASVASVLAEVDTILKPYGGFGAVSRDKQPSNYMLSGELTQLSSMANFVPYLFLFVAALLVNVVLSRLVQLQRSQIATLKAVGYADLSIGLHYLQLVSLIVSLGAAGGVALGGFLGSAMTGLYTSQFFRFPTADYRLQVSAVGFSVGISLASAVVGAWLAVSQVVKLPPAEAMRPPAPARFRRSALEASFLWGWLDPEARMIWREVSRRPLRLLLSAVGISFATGLVVVGRSMGDAIEFMMDVQFHRSMREDVTVTFLRPVDERAVSELAHLPGVHRAEGLRSVPARFRFGHVWRDVTINGYEADAELRQLVDLTAEIHPVPSAGILLTTKLGEILSLSVGDRVRVELREGDWRTTDVTVAGFVDESFGLQGHMTQRALARLVGDGGAINTALLAVDPRHIDDVQARLSEMPLVASVSSPHDLKRAFNEQSASIMYVFTAIITIFAAIIAIGVIYNNARVALSQRTRDLASMRVLGFTRREIAGVLFGEQTIQVALAIPMGLWLGHWLSNAMMSQVDPEMYRFTIVLSPQTYLFAVAVTLASAVVSALVLRRKLERLDLIAVLKTRE